MAEFRIDNMTCGGCARAVTNALKAVDGAAEVSVDLNAHHVRVKSQFSTVELTRALTAAGYAPVTALADQEPF